MPRTAARAQSRASPVVPKPPSKRREQSQQDQNILELTGSDDTPLSPYRLSRSVQPLATKKRPKAQHSPIDVIEISSDEGDVAPSQESLLAGLRSQVKKLKQENERQTANSMSLVQELLLCRTEVTDLKESQHKSIDGKLILDYSEVDDALNCEICTGRMFTPYLYASSHRSNITEMLISTNANRLPDCGHTFCFSCLSDWFGTIHARFLQTNPHWEQRALNASVARIQAILRPEYLTQPQLYHQVQQLQQPMPEYTCPTCRKRVYRRPVEDYALKNLVRIISAANKGEKEDILPDQPFVGPRHGHPAVIGPWDNYFPNERY